MTGPVALGGEIALVVRIGRQREHVANGKPAPDLYYYAADRLGVLIADCLIIEDSFVGVAGAARTGAFVVGLCAGTHCGSDHAARLCSLGANAVAGDFGSLARLLDLR